MGDRGFAMAVELVVEVAVETVEIAMASAMGLHGVPLLTAAFRGSPWNSAGARGRSAVARGVFAVVR